MKSEYKEEIVRTFTLTLAESEAGQVMDVLQDWHDWGRDELPNYIPDVFKEMLAELSRMIIESEVNQ